MVSIIIPTYNNPKELGLCLKSLEKQTFTDFEIIIVDDGSEPAVESKLSDYDVPFKYFRIEHGGANVARNFGYSKSSGDFLLFCDSDAELQPEMLGKLFAALEAHHEAAYAYSSFTYGLKDFILWSFDEKKLRDTNYIHTTSLIRREHFPGFDESIKRFQDWDLWLTMLESGQRGVWVDEVLFKIHTGRGTMSGWLPKGVYSIAKTLGISFGRVKKYEEAKKVIQRKHRL